MMVNEYGCGYGYGTGYGDVNAYGYGTGFGDCYGYGYGTGTGYGDVNAYGYGTGFGDGDGEKIGEIEGLLVYTLSPWPYIQVGCKTHSIENWRENWREFSYKHGVVVSQKDAEALLSRAMVANKNNGLRYEPESG